MFWSDVTADTISRAKLDGSEVTVLVNFGLSDVGKSGRSPKQLYQFTSIMSLPNMSQIMNACTKTHRLHFLVVQE